MQFATTDLEQCVATCRIDFGGLFQILPFLHGLGVSDLEAFSLVKRFNAHFAFLLLTLPSARVGPGHLCVDGYNLMLQIDLDSLHNSRMSNVWVW